jgi:hypothetical protein
MNGTKRRLGYHDVEAVSEIAKASAAERGFRRPSVRVLDVLLGALHAALEQFDGRCCWDTFRDRALRAAASKAFAAP